MIAEAPPISLGLPNGCSDTLFFMRDCTEEELAAIDRASEEFAREKAAHKITIPYGLQYSPHYLKQSRSPKP